VKHKAAFGALIGGILSLTSPVASAATVVVTYTGSVSSGSDQLGLFGTAGASLANTSFVARYIFDTNVGRITTGSSDLSYGGYSFKGAASPLVSATLKIGNVTQSVGGAALADLGYFNLLGGTYYEASAVSNPFIETHVGVISYSDMVFGDFLKTAIGSINQTMFESGLTGGMSDNGGPAYSGFFDFNAKGGVSTFGTFASGGEVQVSVIPKASSLLKSFSVPAPEPTTWMMMIAGFGFIGAMLRRKLGLRSGFAAA
jgi:hypothetical protein